MGQRRLQSNQAAQSISGTIENPQGPAKDFGKQFERAGDKQRHAFGTLEGEHFRHQLAQYDVQKSDRRKGDNDRAQVGDVSGASSRGNPGRNRLEYRSDRRLANPTKRERSYGDSQLRGRNKRGGIREQAQRRLGAAAASRRAGFEPGPSHGH